MKIDNYTNTHYTTNMSILEVADVKEFTVSETAELLQVNRVTVWQWIQDGLLPARRKGLGAKAPYLVKQEDVLRAADTMGLKLDLLKDGGRS